MQDAYWQEVQAMQEKEREWLEERNEMTMHAESLSGGMRGLEAELTALGERLEKEHERFLEMECKAQDTEV